MVSLRAKIVIALMHILCLKNRKEIIIEKHREILEKRLVLALAPKELEVKEEVIDGIKGEWVYTKECVNDRTILYLHGGSYISGSIKTHRALAANLAKVTKAKALIIDYRLAPENPFPAAIEDANAVYKWLTKEKKIPAKKIIIAGDSAGGGLTVATLLSIKEEGMELPAAAILFSPWVDLTLSGKTIKEKRKIEPLLTEEELRQAAEMYLNGEEKNNPLASPVYAELKKLPPLIIQVGTSEILLDDSIRLAEKAEEEGVKVYLDVWEKMIHGFQMFSKYLPESKKALEKVGKIVEEIMGNEREKEENTNVN
ncbi:MAG: alpha/beta hydrolase [Candidatus Heimdallarchaeaceae archaeon]